jgi:hypothetical protein
MRPWLALTGILATTACVASVASSRELPVLTPRMLDTTLAVGTPEDRRDLGDQVQRCYHRQTDLLRGDELARVSAQRKRAALLAGVGAGGALVTWLVITHAGIGPGALALLLAGTAVIRAVPMANMPSAPPNREDIRERAWTDVVHQVEAWEPRRTIGRMPVTTSRGVRTPRAIGWIRGSRRGGTPMLRCVPASLRAWGFPKERRRDRFPTAHRRYPARHGVTKP